MELDNPPICAPLLEDAIDRYPLKVTPDTAIVSIIALMSQLRVSSCSLPSSNLSSDFNPIQEARSSCVLVMRDRELIGIFTERDLVQLTAAGKNLESLTVAEVMAHPVITLPQANFSDVFAALFLFRRYRIRHLPLVGDRGEVVGVVSPESIRSCLRPANLLKLRRVAEVMETQVIQASLTASVLSLAQLMARHRVSCVVILEEVAERGYLPVGIVTERDLVQFQFLGLDLSKIKAETVMSTPLFLLSPEDTLWTAYQQMQRRHVQRLVVSWNWGEQIGLVTQTRLLRVFDPVEMYGVIETLQRTLHQLEAEQTERSQKLIN